MNRAAQLGGCIDQVFLGIPSPFICVHSSGKEGRLARGAGVSAMNHAPGATVLSCSILFIPDDAKISLPVMFLTRKGTGPSGVFLRKRRVPEKGPGAWECLQLGQLMPAGFVLRARHPSLEV